MWGLARATRILAIRLVAALLAAVSLAGCRLDQEERLRAELAGWLDLRDTLEFQSRSTCTGAVFLLENTGISDQVTRATSVDTAIHYLRAGRIVAFELFDTSPTVVSEQIMTASLEQGLGLLSNGIGPAKRCLSDRAGMVVYAAITSPEAVMVYDPGGNALTLVHLLGEVPLAIFLRGNV